MAKPERSAVQAVAVGAPAISNPLSLQAFLGLSVVNEAIARQSVASIGDRGKGYGVQGGHAGEGRAARNGRQQKRVNFFCFPF
jgi:hypothetical protein